MMLKAERVLPPLGLKNGNQKDMKPVWRDGMSYNKCLRRVFDEDRISRAIEQQLWDQNMPEAERKYHLSVLLDEEAELYAKQASQELLEEAEPRLDVIEIMLEEKEKAFNEIVYFERLEMLPTRYRNMTFDDYHYNDEKGFKIVEHLKSGSSAILYGPNGTGKTMLAFCSVKYQWEQGKYAQYILAADFFDLVRKSFDKGDPLGLLREFTEFDYLVVDEVDKMHGSQTEHIYLYRLINERYNENKHTVLISNAGKQGLMDVIGQSTFSRIAGEGAVIAMPGEDYRRKGV